MKENHSKQDASSVLGWVWGGFSLCSAILGPIGTGLLVCILVVVAFYQEENWRGRHAWERVKTAAIAKGLEMDWNKLMPPPVPEASNFFAAPHMQDWFTGRGARDITKRIDFGKFSSTLEYSNCVLAKVTIVPPETDLTASDADIVLSFRQARLFISNGPEDAFPSFTNSEIIPVIDMNDVPLRRAITNLGNAAGLRFQPSANSIKDKLYVNIDTVPIGPTVGCHWTNITAREALLALLANYNLRLVPGYGGYSARIMKKFDQGVDVPTDVATKLSRLIYDRVQEVAGTNDAEHLTAALGFELATKSVSSIKPLHVAVRCYWTPDMYDVEKFFPRNAVGGTTVTRARQIGSNAFEVFVDFPPRVAAADYLKWSDQFQSDFDAISAAAKRPYARMAGDYSKPQEMPIPNFVTLRMLAQTFSQRAQCHILLRQPEEAAKDLMFIREICRATEGKPTQRPMTLVAAMVDTAIMGLYAQTFGDGLRLNAWREHDYAAIEEQLKDVDLVPLLAGGLDCERMSGCWMSEHMTAENYRRLMHGLNYSPPPGSTKQLINEFRDPVFQLLFFAPKGWRYQNAITIERLYENGFGGVDLTNKFMRPKRADEALKLIDKELTTRSPFTIMAAITIPNFVRASTTVEHNQTLLNQTRIVCALERYRMAHGQYPDTLDALVPQYIEALPRDVIGGNPYKYERKGDDFNLSALAWDEKSYVDWPHHRK